MRARWLVPAFLLASLFAAACGTSTLELGESSASPPDALSAEADERPSASSSITSSTTEAPSTTTSSTTTTSTTTTTTTIAPLALDDEGVPVNGQTNGVLITPTGWRVPVLGGVDGVWRVWTPCGREALVAGGTFVERVDVVLDPGHGGREPGATGANGLIEAHLNLAVSKLAATRLQELGYSVLLTRVDDVRVPIATRAEIALAVQARALVSVHHNAGTDAPSSSPGTEVFHQIESAESRRLAGLLYEETVATLSGFSASWVSMGDAGALVRPNREGGDFYGMLRRPATVPSVISEAAYLSNPSEAELLDRSDVQQALADALVRGIDRFLSTADPGSGFTDDPIFRGYGSSGTGRTTDCDDPDLG